MSHSFMFQALSREDLNIVIGAMAERHFKKGETVIKQGDAGAVLFVLEEGSLDCHKVFSEGEGPKFLKTYVPGEAFGELALLYNAPRAATITARTDSICWELDRGTFNHIVKDSAQKKRDKYDEFLLSVKILDSIDSYERAKIADVIQEKDYNAGERVIREGEDGSTFYLVISGDAYAEKLIDGKNKEVMKYRAGDYFGELALLKNEPRAATIVARSQLKLALIDRDSFKRLLGPLDQILMRNMANYSNYL